MWGAWGGVSPTHLSEAASAPCRLAEVKTLVEEKRQQREQVEKIKSRVEELRKQALALQFKEWTRDTSGQIPLALVMWGRGVPRAPSRLLLGHPGKLALEIPPPRPLLPPSEFGSEKKRSRDRHLFFKGLLGKAGLRGGGIWVQVLREP